jgi:aspartate/methionine/tyrosine aminotransferase
MTRLAIEQLPASRIREVANAGLGRDDVLAFWFGESDEVTPQAVRDAAAASLQRGETFYSHNLGLPELRQAIAAYTTALHGANGAVGPERVAVTSSGVSALMVAMQMLAGPGDEVVAVVPVWPNLTAQPAILGARVVRVPLAPRADGAWALDLDRVRAAVTDRTRVLLVNAPNNPTGWTLTRAEQQALLDHCRRTGTWIVADEVYERVWFGPGAAAPSFLDLATPEDRLVVVHSFSKSFLMTGWRLGWMVLPPAQLDAAGKLLEFNTSCPPVFVQRGAQAALAIADGFVPGLVQRLKAGRDRLHDGLARLPGVHAAAPLGGMYAWFRIDGETDSLALAKRLVRGHGLGLAPGVAFGPEGEGWLRWCFASQDLARLDAGVQRLAEALARPGP